MKNTIFSKTAVFISLMLLVISGCENSVVPSVSDIPEGSAVEETQLSDQPETTEIVPVAIEANEADNMRITESDQIPGWKKLEARVPLSELTECGSQPLQDSEELVFSLHFPGNWTMSYTVFYDDNSQKVAEIPPVVLLKPGQEAEFLTYNPSAVGDGELLTKTDFPVSSYKGSRTVTRIATEMGSWHPHVYRITYSNYGFSIVFYSHTINDEDQDLFDRIAGTVRFWPHVSSS
ncbi:MAG: hypothetical protein ACOX0E_09350 [Syntrophomonadaceae bacterium]|jgi:hypothetical protein